MLEPPANIERFLSSPVAVFGYARSGQAITNLLQRLGLRCQVYDSQVEKAGCLSTFTLANARCHQLVVYSPGFSPQHPWLCLAREAGCLCLSEFDFAAAFWHGPALAVTGTNGKSTLTKFLCYVLNASGVKAVAVGNIGVPFSKVYAFPRYEEKVAVCEVSSFQAETLQYFRASALLWTNFSEDHLDRHKSMSEYFRAKAHLISCLVRPRLYIGPTVVAAAKEYGFELPPFTQIVDWDETQVPEGTVFSLPPQRENYLLALKYLMDERFNPELIKAAAREFLLPEHCLQPVAEVDGVTFWNDSKGTNFSATLAAVKSFQKPIHWIGGGKYKGGNLAMFVANIAPHIKRAVLLGETAQPLCEQLTNNYGVKATIVAGVEEAVRASFHQAEKEDIILFSPAFSSFDLYKSYEHRGECYEDAVLNFKRKTVAI